ncbi:metallophosphoesterase family protein [Chengkuizengella marina]|uniref:Metallophosphoesterase n=1 Tax=Chengkuizengella marina TaxID=2507566 RepID=A0A6N9Q1G9_9BACL|nr:metallophosphoesterase family protein [Chengkuizengella marina]NBI27904.1 metallophosphoesterase [Chengkuizengella marina]
MINQVKIAIISDIHGNSWALEAVLEDIKKRGVTDVVNLGDSLTGPLDPRRTAEKLQFHKITSIKGNQDRLILKPTEEFIESSTYTYVKEQLSSDDLLWLDQQSETLSLNEDIFLCHGTPSSDEAHLLEEVTQHGVYLRNSEEIEKDVKDIKKSVICCAHSHVPRTVYLPTGQIVLNPGSVGMPAYVDDLPYPHHMESGNPHANYVVLNKNNGPWTIEHLVVPYNWNAAADKATENGRDDWAKWIKLGRI